MTKNQTFEVLKFIKSVYANFEVTQERIDNWTRLLKNNDPAKVMKNAEQYALDNKFPPTVADIKAPPLHDAHKKDYLEKIKQWEEDASGGPERTH